MPRNHNATPLAIAGVTMGVVVPLASSEVSLPIAILVALALSLVIYHGTTDSDATDED
jgi:uncharacterized membrane protein YjfL (UPF0719 family)